nr:MAG TPA: hypothetical protein [Inoviridae sp.]
MRSVCRDGGSRWGVRVIHPTILNFLLTALSYCGNI